MDTSKEYIEMCEKAQEVQELRDTIDDFKRINLFVRKFESVECKILTKEVYNQLPEEYKQYCVFKEEERQNKAGLVLVDNDELIKWGTGEYVYSCFLLNREISWAEELGNDIFIWLPRQDQLSDMITTWNKQISIAFFQNISFNSSYRRIPTRSYDSIEKHLLCFLMFEEHNKFWDIKNKEWRNK